MDETYKLDELAQAAGTSPRTVRYYVQRGLIPAPAFRGKDTAYGQEHLVRLRAVRRLAEASLALDAIGVELEGRSLGEIERIADGTELPSRANVSTEVVCPPLPTVHPPLFARALLERVALASGIELTIATDAPPESRRLAEHLLRAAETSLKRGRGK